MLVLCACDGAAVVVVIFFGSLRGYDPLIGDPCLRQDPSRGLSQRERMGFSIDSAEFREAELQARQEEEGEEEEEEEVDDMLHPPSSNTTATTGWGTGRLPAQSHSRASSDASFPIVEENLSEVCPASIWDHDFQVLPLTDSTCNGDDPMAIHSSILRHVALGIPWTLVHPLRLQWRM